ncbi:hypothetical protein [Pontibacter amylolyticus]|uniref:Adhesin domain-containing protein n=1 Tax=Pontibacter amylolyticus TaxID=1424080 RepID=A0ABQ1W2D4_9BACT|nr:hypothetical protein [Pontibacter amylolyticus]GGG11438.1 hypothetical protein GCM10011323_14940 [Pontibacter amylolyticus]
MKKIWTIALLWLVAIAGVQAQSKTVERTLAVPANNKVELNLRFGEDIKISSWNKKEAYIKVTYEINSGKLNEALQLGFETDNTSARVKVDLDEKLTKNGQAADCPDNNYSQYNVSKNGDRNFICAKINYEIFLPANADLTVETINGNIELRGLNGPVSAKSISGFVDMNWASNKGAAVALKTITGEVYSDLAIDLADKKQKAPMVGYELKGNVSGGGSPIKLESISNDIYFRKKD